MGQPIPGQLNQPICKMRIGSEANLVGQPVGFLTPTIDGLVTDFFEWRGAGTINTQPPLGAMWKTDHFFTAIRFGWSLDQFVIRFDPGETTSKKQGIVVDITLQSSESTFRLTFPFAFHGPGEFLLSRQSSPETWQEIGCHRTINSRSITELSLLWKEIHVEPGQTLQMSIVVRDHGLEVARYPSPLPAVLIVPGPEFEAECWRV